MQQQVLPWACASRLGRGKSHPEAHWGGRGSQEEAPLRREASLQPQVCALEASAGPNVGPGVSEQGPGRGRAPGCCPGQGALEPRQPHLLQRHARICGAPPWLGRCPPRPAVLLAGRGGDGHWL